MTAPLPTAPPLRRGAFQRQWFAGAVQCQPAFQLGHVLAFLGGYSRLHQEEAEPKCQKCEAEVTLPSSTAWPDNAPSEQTPLWAGDPALQGRKEASTSAA